jgi:putative ABC transport system permease protein
MNAALPARRAVMRWAWRSFRREWRQQVLVLALLTVAVAGATFSAAAVYNATTDPAGEFGAANQRIMFDNNDPAATAADIAAARSFFGTVDVISGHAVTVAGDAAPVELRAEDPRGPFTHAMVELRRGRYPVSANEVAVTESLAERLNVGIGGSFDADGNRLSVVGLVENPGRLDDEFALLSPSSTIRPDVVSLLVSSSPDKIEQFRSHMTVSGNVGRESRSDDRKLAAVLTFVLATVGLLLVALIAAAGFLVIAQRRLRSLGMLAAIGAPERQLRLVTLTNGALVGVVAAVGGCLVGIAAWAATRSRFVAAANHRIDGMSVPVWLVAISAVLAVLTSVAAAWWPARVVARVPVVQALSDRPPRPVRTHRSLASAVVLIAAGEVCFWLAHQRSVILTVLGTVLAPLGVLMLAPALIRAAGGLAARLPISGRLALRDLGRYQTRAGAALAAISLALGVPVAVVVSANAASHSGGPGNLAANQMLIRVGSTGKEPFIVRETSGSAQATLDAQVDEFASTLDHGRALALDAAIDPNAPPEPGLTPSGEVQTAQIGYQEPGGDPHRYSGLITYVATPAVLRQFGITSQHDLYTTLPDGQFFVLDMDKARAQAGLPPERIDDVGEMRDPRYSALPHNLVSPAFVAKRGWTTARGAYLVESNSPITAAQRAAAVALATSAGLTVETRDPHASLAQMRTITTAIGMVLALGVLAMAAGLMRAEVAGDLRILTATGATTTVRRRLTAATTATLAVLGVVIGVAGAYLVLAGAFANDLGRFLPVPTADLLAIAIGVPVLAAATGWLFAGRQPSTLTRAVIA